MVMHPSGADRPRQTENIVANVLVPKAGTVTAKFIKRGSGIVSRPVESGRLLAYYEGNLYDFEDMDTFEKRVFHAYDRMVTRYPTVACGLFEPGEFVVVGQYDKVSGLRIQDQQTLDAWLAGCGK